MRERTLPPRRGGPDTARRRLGRPAGLLARAAVAALLILPGLSATAAAAPSTVPDLGVVTNGPVYASTSSGSTLYLGGSFTQIGPRSGPGVALDPTTGADQHLPQVSGAGATVSAVIPDGSGGWYIGGSFTHVGPAARSGLAHINSDGSVDANLPQVASIGSAFPAVNTLLLSNGTLYVGGNFNVIGGINRTDLAAVDVTSDTVSPTWDPHPNSAFSPSLTVNALALSGSSLFVGGAFSTIGGASRSNLAAVDATPSGSGSATGWNAPATFANSFASPMVSALLISGSTLYAGGSFDTIGSNVLTRHNLAALDVTSGDASITWNPNVGDATGSSSGTVTSLALSGSALYVGGGFPTVGGAAHPGLAAVASDATGGGTVFGGWDPSGATSNLGVQAPSSPAVTALSAAGGTLYVGGNFTTVGANAAARSDLAALNADADSGGIGSATSWNPGANNPVLALATAGQTVYAGGAMTSVGGVSRTDIAAVDTGTGQVTAFDPRPQSSAGGPYAGAAPAVRALALSGAGDTLYAGGQFDTIGVNHQARTALAALDTTTGDATSFAPGVTGTPQNPPVVYSLLVSGTDLYVGGAFATIGANAVPRTALAAVDTTSGNAFANWDPAAAAPSGGGSSQPPTVYSLALSGTTLYAGGYFTSIGGHPRDGLAALSSDPAAAAAASSWDPAPETGDPGSSATVYALALSGSDVFVGGSFGQMGGQQRRGVAEIDAGTGDATGWAPDARGSVYALAVSGNTAFIGGSFHTIGHVVTATRNNLAAVDLTSGDPINWDPNATGNLGVKGSSPAAVVDALSVSGAKVTAGDAFATFDQAPASGIATFTDSAPSATAPPGISPGGSPTQGETLTETQAVWTGSPGTATHQWLRCDSTGANCAAVPGQTGASYVVGSADVGFTLRVQETVPSGAGYSNPATSDPTAVVAADANAPANSALPTISGLIARGQTLTADPGTWSGTNDAFSYQWMRCDASGANCLPVTSQTGTSYPLSATDAGDTIRVAVSAVDGSSGLGSAPVMSNQTTVVPAVPVATSPPSISGTATQGQTLTEAHGSWSGSPTSYAYQWLRCSPATGCTAISGATNPAYVVTSADVGSTIKVQETAANAAGNGNASVSGATPVVQGPAGSPVDQTPPAISGNAMTGQTLTEGHGTWSNLPNGYVYQWLRCGSGSCAPIQGATSQTYVVALGDLGFTIEVSESAFNSAGTGAAAYSPPTQAVVASPTSPPLNITPPTIAGTDQVGQTLDEGHGSWANIPTSYSYSWQRCNPVCAPISGASGSSYTLTNSDIGFTIVVSESATNVNGTSATPALSSPTATVSAAPPGVGTLPSISGTPQQGQTLTEVNGVWSSNPTSYSYQWLTCDSSGAGCSPISGATGSTYQAQAGDVGGTLRVEEWATNGSGTAGPAISVASAGVLPPAPVSTAAPGISGTAQQGQTLQEVHGTWSNNPTAYSYQWQQCDSGGASCTDIANATQASYVPVANDVNHTLRVEEWGTNAGGQAGPAVSGATTAVLPAPPTITAAPTISGSAHQGQTLTEAHGTWSGSPTGFTYQWQQCDSSGSACSDIPGATASTYVLSAGDVGWRIRVEEFATNAGGVSAPAPAAATAAVIPLPPVNTAPPAITGAARQGQALIETHGSWDNNPTGYAVQWQRCDVNGANCSAISGASGQTYVLTLADAGHTIVASETASNAGGTGSGAASAASGVVVPLAPVDTTPPGTSGTPQDGQTVTETHGNWANAPTSYTYAWQRCDSSGNACTTLSASGAAYQAVTADVGHTLRVQEWATNVGGTTGPATSAATSVVLPAAPVSSAAPTIAGTAQDGQSLTEAHGTWSGAPTSYSYAWLRCDSGGGSCSPIAGATAGSYVLADADVGHTVEVSETAANAGGPGAPATSAPSAVVAPPPAPSNNAAPTISGTAQIGQTLTEGPGSWSPSPSSVADRWQRCDASGAGCADVAGATGASYTLGSDDVGHALRVVETATNPGGSASATSAPTAAVAQVPAPSSVSPPAISGVAQQGQTLTESHGGWSGAPSAYGYQWLRCDAGGAGCAAIPGAAARSYVLSAADVGATIRVQETASNAGGSSSAAMSAPTGGVAPAPGAPGSGSQPSAAPGGSSGGSPGGSSGGGMPSLTQTGSARLSLSGRALMLDGGLQVGCRAGGAACSVTLVLTTPRSATRKGHSKTAGTLTLGRTQVVVGAGHSQELTLRLSSAAASLLAAKHRLSAMLRVSVNTGALPPVTASRALSLSNPPRKRAAKHH